MTCPLCNDTGEQRYWEGRWRDEKAQNERLRTTLLQIAIDDKDQALTRAQCMDIARAAIVPQQSQTEPK